MTQQAPAQPNGRPLAHIFNKEKLVPSLTTGFVAGLSETAMAVSLAALIFSGPLVEFRSLGIGLAILGAILSSLIVALFTSLPGTLGGNQELPAVIMALVTADIIFLLPDGTPVATILITVLAAIAITTAITGLVFIGVAQFQLGSLVRFLPYPVVGGFLAATGWLLVIGALSVMAPLPHAWAEIGLVLQSDLIWRWLPGIAVGLILLIWTQRSDSVLVMPVVLIAGTLLFYLVVWTAGLPTATLQQEGWLLGPFSGGGLWQPLPLEDLVLIDWLVLVEQAGHILTVALVSVIALLLNAGGVELATKKDMDMNHELRAAGIGNLLSSLVSGLVGFQQLGFTAINFKLGANTRLTGMAMAFVCLLTLLFGASILSLAPQFVVAGLLLYLGLDFLYEWVVQSWKKMPRLDYAILISILLLSIVGAFWEAIVLGLLLAVVLFVIGYSRIEIVRRECSGAIYGSRVVRSRSQMHVLRDRGRQLFILQLQGFIFFGTADHLLKRVRDRLYDSQQPQVKVIYLDFNRVTGLDSTALLSFNRMKQLAEEQGAVLVFSAPLAGIRQRLEEDGLGDDGEKVRFFPSLDLALQWGEDRLLAQAAAADRPAEGSLVQRLSQVLPAQIDVAHLLSYFERIETRAGQKLIQMGRAAQDLYIIDTGQATIQIPRPGRPPLRLESVGCGHVVGEIGLYLGQERSADVVFDQPGAVYHLSPEAFRRMEQRDAQAAGALHRLIVHLMAERITRATDTLNFLNE